MHILQNRFIKYKLILICMLTTGIALLFGSGILIINEFFSFRRSMINDLTIQAKIIANNSTAALAFHDQKNAREILSALKSSTNIEFAVIYTQSGETFAIFENNKMRKDFVLPPSPESDGYRVGTNYLDAFQHIVFNNKTIGTVYIRSDLEKLYSFLKWYACVIGFVISGSLGIAFLMISRLQRTVTKPVLLLRETTKKVALGDFTAKAEIITKDEIGQLTSDFNKMTESLQVTTVSKDYVDSIINNLMDSLVVLDQDYTIQKVNQSTLNLLGYTSRELLDQSVDVICENGRNLFRETIAVELERKGRIINIEQFYLTKRGEKISVILSCSLILNDDGKIQGIVCVAKDITERKQIENERQELQIKMMAASKLASLGEIATGIAHEINQPLTYLSSFVQRMRRKLEQNILDKDKLKKELEISYNQIDRIVTIIDHLRVFGRRDQMEKQQISIETVFNNTLILMEESVRMRNITLIKNIEHNLPLIWGNPNQLEQVFINLLQNSVGAFDKNTKDGEIFVDISFLKAEGLVVIKVSDNGIGIERKNLNKIFEPFFSTKEVGKGTGLGLSIVYGIVQEHRGSIECESTINKGTTLKIELPIR